MTTLETVFDINRILVTLFNALEELRKKKNIELVYEMDAHIPKELRGDSTVLLRLLTQTLSFVLTQSDRHEILLTLSAPEDFLFEEEISFRIKESGIGKENLLNYLEANISRDLESLGGRVVYKDEELSDASFNIPFKINELGFRRHYRLPVDTMLDKKVLIICESTMVSHSLKKFFRYFHYEVDAGLDTFNKKGSDLEKYDIFLTEEKLTSGEVGSVIAEAEKLDTLRLVVLKGQEKVADSNIHFISSYLSKPVTQESIYNLILQLFDPEFENIQLEKKEELKAATEPEKVAKEVIKDEVRDTIESKRREKYKILDLELGQNNTKKMGLNYRKELKYFLDTFEHSDIYFRNIVHEKAITKIKVFCADLEKYSRAIGADSMLNLTDIVSFILVYNKLDMLDIYPGRYHLELEKLLAEIKKHI